jgi:hypothetical protein
MMRPEMSLMGDRSKITKRTAKVQLEVFNTIASMSRPHLIPLWSAGDVMMYGFIEVKKVKVRMLFDMTRARAYSLLVVS